MKELNPNGEKLKHKSRSTDEGEEGKKEFLIKNHKDNDNGTSAI